MSATDLSVLDPATEAATPIVSVRPVVLAAPDRGDDLQVRVSAK